jgi:uncharacterized membrane protein
VIKKLWPGIVLIIGAAIFGFTVSGQLPERVASHWGVNGEVNGWSSRGFLLVLVPAIGLLMSIILAYAPTLDPKRRNFPMHAAPYWIITNTVLAFLACAHVLVIGYNLGWKINFTTVVGVGIGLLFMLMGNLLTQVRPNWIMGIRTPWTLSSDRSWRETHRIGGYGFVFTGLATLITTLTWPTRVHYVAIGGMIVTVISSVVWSYLAWKRDPDAQGRDA